MTVGRGGQEAHAQTPGAPSRSIARSSTSGAPTRSQSAVNSSASSWSRTGCSGAPSSFFGALASGRRKRNDDQDAHQPQICFVRSLVMFFWWLSSVPPPISMSLASRRSRSMGYSRQ